MLKRPGALATMALVGMLVLASCGDTAHDDALAAAASMISETGERMRRILPLGDSITYGFGSTTGDGYRLPLLNLLTSSTKFDISYTGTISSGSLSPPQNANEGHPGATISEITSFFSSSLSQGEQEPDLVLLMAGTNDMNVPLETSPSPAITAPRDLAVLIDTIQISLPNAIILVSNLVPARNGATERNIEMFNSQLPALISKKAEGGKKIALVDISSSSLGKFTDEDLGDGLHPNDKGYEKIAEAFYEGIVEAEKEGWFSAVVETETGVVDGKMEEEQEGLFEVKVSGTEKLRNGVLEFVGLVFMQVLGMGMG